MWQRFTERARKAVFDAQEEAVLRDDGYVAPEHLMLGMLREKDTVAVRILQKLGASPEQLQETLAQQTAQGKGRKSNDMQLTPRCKRAIDLAYDEARQFDNNYIGTEHLLLGILRESEGRSLDTLAGRVFSSDAVVGRVLGSMGINIDRARAALKELQGDVQGRSSEPTEGSGLGAGVARLWRASKTLGEVKPLTQSLPRLIRGQIGVLRDGERRRVEFVPEFADISLFLNMMTLRDEFAYRELAQSGKFLLLEAGTLVKILVSADQEIVQVRVLEGEFAGRIGYAERGLLYEVRQDDRPFPPEIEPS